MADPIPVMVFVEFARALSFSESSVLAKRIFDIFDIHHVRALNFAQFAVGVSVLSNNCKSVSLARFTFDVYDTKKDDCIDFDELRAMLENSLADRGATYTPEGIASVCRNTMMLLDPEQRGYISFSRYEQVCLYFIQFGLFWCMWRSFPVYFVSVDATKPVDSEAV
jgi:Ca2+-binding EF-hand superfamily protein